jgi:predicted HicB family RNase H-like nuclease
MFTATLTGDALLAKEPENRQPDEKLLGVRISAALHTRLKTHAAKTGRSMAELVEEAIKDLLKKK